MRKSASRPLRRSVLVVSVLVAAGGCGGDGDDGTVATDTVGRYCDLARQFDDIAAATGAASGPGKLDGTPEAVTQLATQMGPVLGELEASAPETVRSQVETTVEALRKAAEGDTAVVRSDDVSAAAQEMKEFAESSCTTAASSGEG